MADLLENAIAKYGNKLEIFRIVTNGGALRAGEKKERQTANAENTLQQRSQ